MNHKPRVLFFSTGDSTRSQMAEGFLRTLAGNEVVAVSVAVDSVASDPITNEVMKEVGIDISEQRPKAVAESLKEHFSFVVTICDASKERFPVWPFSRNTFQWNLIAPERVNGSVEQKREAFRGVRDEISQRVQEFVMQIHPQLHTSS